MNILFFIPAFLVFLYCLYKLVKDDYVFIRKNVSIEQIVDMAFIALWIGLIFSRIFSMIVHPLPNQNLILGFFSLQAHDFSSVSFFLGSTIGLYILGKYKKLPIERLFNTFTVSFSVALPIGLLIYLISLRDYQLLVIFINVILYGGFAYILIKYLKNKYLIFSLFFFLISIGDSTVLQYLNHKSFITTDNIIIVILFLLSLGLLIKQRITRS